MNTIHLNNICPDIFQNQPDLTSDIWNHDVVFEKGKIYLIEAQSGTGKSSLCSYICGFRNDFQGELLFDDINSAKLEIADWSNLRKRHISHLIQDLRLFPELSAYENIEIKNKMTHQKSEKQIMDLMSCLEIQDKRDIPVGKLSFGQQQRVAMIRALVQPFDFILTDEPISHLDDYHSKLMGELLLNEVHQQNAGVIVTSIGKHLPIPYDKVFQL